MTPRVGSVVWDLGAVVIDWNPRYLYRTLLPDDDAVEAFLGEVCTPAWHHRHDEGRPMAEGVAELIDAFPDRADLIRAYVDRWDDMFAGQIEGSVALIDELAAAGVPQYGLTNWPAEMFPRARARFPVLGRLKGVVVSGEEGVAKPSPGCSSGCSLGSVSKRRRACSSTTRRATWRPPPRSVSRSSASPRRPRSGPGSKGKVSSRADDPRGVIARLPAPLAAPAIDQGKRDTRE